MISHHLHLQRAHHLLWSIVISISSIAFITLSFVYMPLTLCAEDLSPAPSAATSENANTPSDELHFVSVLTVSGKLVSVDQTNNQFVLKSSEGRDLTFEIRNADDLARLMPGDNVTVRYFEGGQVAPGEIGGEDREASFAHGIIASKSNVMVTASVVKVDEINQEITVKGRGDGVETLMVVNPESLEGVKAGDRVSITNPQALALTIAHES